jgi:hypothetical protein
MYIMTCDSKINLFVSHIDHGAYMSAGGGVSPYHDLMFKIWW